MHFCMFLADSLTHASIKVGLIPSHRQWFSRPCLQLQQLLRGIKCVHGLLILSCLPITMELMKFLQKALDFNNANHVKLCTACCVGFFSFLHVGEFIVNSTFDLEIHLSVCDLQVDCLMNPSDLKIHIKCSGCDAIFPK